MSLAGCGASRPAVDAARLEARAVHIDATGVEYKGMRLRDVRIYPSEGTEVEYTPDAGVSISGSVDSVVVIEEVSEVQSAHTVNVRDSVSVEECVKKEAQRSGLDAIGDRIGDSVLALALLIGVGLLLYLLTRK